MILITENVRTCWLVYWWCCRGLCWRRLCEKGWGDDGGFDRRRRTSGQPFSAEGGGRRQRLGPLSTNVYWNNVCDLHHLKIPFQGEQNCFETNQNGQQVKEKNDGYFIIFIVWKKRNVFINRSYYIIVLYYDHILMTFHFDNISYYVRNVVFLHCSLQSTLCCLKKDRCSRTVPFFPSFFLPWPSCLTGH